MSEGTAMGGTNDEDLERLANRIALLAGEDGEADAAGRAVGNLARRLGLSGGHLKAIFLAGAGRLALAGRQAAEQAARADRMEAEAGQLRHSLELVDSAFRDMERERDDAITRAGFYRENLERARTGRRIVLLLTLVVVIVAAGAVGFVVFGPPLRPLLGLSFDPRSARAHMAAVGDRGASVLAEPDAASPVLYKLPTGVLIAVRQLLWRDFNQWAETRIAGHTGYVVVTSVVLQPDCR